MLGKLFNSVKQNSLHQIPTDEASMDFLNRLNFSMEELRSIPASHAGFLVTSCLANNEINVFVRLYLMSLNTVSHKRPISDDALNEYAYVQCVILQRHISAKVFEYLNMIERFAKKLKGHHSPIHAYLLEVNSVIKEIRKAKEFALATWYRNKTTNHYDIGAIMGLVGNKKVLPDTAEMSIYLHEKDGNSGYLLGEQILLAQTALNEVSAIEQIRGFETWLLATVKRVTTLHHNFCIKLMETHFPGKTVQEFPINPESHLVGSVTSSCLPILWDLSDPRLPS